ncbi:putative G-protein coupled receptor Mth-like 3 [Armadillidium nasatum]|uniref:Putative G-protein coupled receptor Mth-like 3 n=1 Tax=Armadillidium nasatum TaxID=96803 RepID=A0A5N5T754_9CRUS|nr:putative G-protein coupled receptor Mth-like 3 [Armadillidium nasatum]
MEKFFVIFGLLFICKVSCQNDSQSYFPSSYIDRESSLVYSKLHKCFCLWDQILVDDVCQSQNVNTTMLGLIEGYSSTTEQIDINVIDKVIVESLVCPSNYLTLTLPGDSFALRTSGSLFNINYGLNFNFSMYCIEQTVNEQDQISMEVHICLPIPLVPRCCPQNSYDPVTNQCKDINGTDVGINIMFAKRLVQLETKSFSILLNCENSEETVKVPLNSDSHSSQMKLTNEGLILSHKVSPHGDAINIPSPEYCVEMDTNSVATSASYCYIDPISAHLEFCEGVTCIRKCCPLGEAYDMTNYRCVPVDLINKWTPKFYNKDTYAKEIVKEYKIIVGFPLNCDFTSLSPNNDPPDFFQLLSNGSLYVKNWHLSLSSSKYCLDNFIYEESVMVEAMVCFPQPKAEGSSMCHHVGQKLYPSLLLISSIFLIITLTVYAIIPDLHSKIQGFLIQFSVLSAFFWLNVMSYDIWRTLRSMKSGRDSPAGARKRFLYYSLYAWGCPFLIVIVTVIMQFLPKYLDRSNLILPRIGEYGCIVTREDKRAFWLYINGYISIILIANCFFYFHLSYILIKARKFSENALGKKTQILTDIVNSLRGFFIFIIFVCKRDVIKKLKKYFN